MNKVKTQLQLYLQLGKFRLCLLVLFTALVGYWLGAVRFDWLALFCFLIGTLLTAMGANGLNQWWERDRDAKMVRTRNRPLPSGKMTSHHALLMTSTWAVSGIGILYVGVNFLTAYLGFITLVCYLTIYTPLKPHSSLAVLVGAIPGAIPPVMGWAAATNRLDAEAFMLGCILFLWQIPHFMSLASIYRLDYDKGGYQLLPDNPENERATRSIIVVFSLALLVVSLLAPALGLGSTIFLLGSTLLGFSLLFMSIKFYQQFSIKNARTVFRASIIYMPLLMTLLVIDQSI